MVLKTFEGVTCTRRPRTTFYISYTFVCKKVPGKLQTNKLYGKSKASLWRNLSTDTSPSFFSAILCFVVLVYNRIVFCSEQAFYRNYSTLDSHANTVISHAFAYSSRWRRKPWRGLFFVTSKIWNKIWTPLGENTLNSRKYLILYRCL